MVKVLFKTFSLIIGHSQDKIGVKSEDNKIKFVRLEGLKALANKNSINFMIFILTFVENSKLSVIRCYI